MRRDDGSLGVTEQLREPGWPSPLASLLWAALPGHETERAATLRWLLATKGVANPRGANEPMGHDLSLIGWPWCAGTHSWVEPTAMALMVLAREGKSAHPRAVEGKLLLQDRAIPAGGWNMGNPIVFGTILRPIPAPTGLALLALASTGTPREFVGPSLAYLRDSLASTHAPVSLGWGLLGLRAWGAWPDRADEWLAESYRLSLTRNANAIDLAMLILAAESRSIPTLGIAPLRKEAAHE